MQKKKQFRKRREEKRKLESKVGAGGCGDKTC